MCTCHLKLSVNDRFPFEPIEGAVLAPDVICKGSYPEPCVERVVTIFFGHVVAGRPNAAQPNGQTSLAPCIHQGVFFLHIMASYHKLSQISQVTALCLLCLQWKNRSFQ